MAREKPALKRYTFVLIRGLSREVRHWNDFPASLENRFPGSRIRLLEIPGNGSLNHRKSPLSIRKIMQEIRTSYLEEEAKEGAGEPFPVVPVAISLGGMIATRWIMDHPEEIFAAILLTTSNGKTSPIYRRLNPASISTGLRFLLARSVQEKETIALSRVSSRRPDPELLGRFAGYMEEYPVSITNTLRQLIAAALFRGLLPREAPPVLYLGSLGDRLVSPLCSFDLARRERCELRMHPTAGHEIALDEPEWCLDQIESFLETIDSRNSRVRNSA